MSYSIYVDIILIPTIPKTIKCSGIFLLQSNIVALDCKIFISKEIWLSANEANIYAALVREKEYSLHVKDAW